MKKRGHVRAPGCVAKTSHSWDRLTYLDTATVGLVLASVVTPAHEFELKPAQAGTAGMDEDLGTTDEGAPR